MKQQTLLTCNACAKHSAALMWDERYSGYRGTCSLCGGNWPES